MAEKLRLQKKSEKPPKTMRLVTNGNLFLAQFEPPLRYKRLMSLRNSGLVSHYVQSIEVDGSSAKYFPAVVIDGTGLGEGLDRLQNILVFLKGNPGSCIYPIPEEIPYGRFSLESLRHEYGEEKLLTPNDTDILGVEFTAH